MSLELILGIIGTAGTMGGLITGYLAGKSHLRTKILDLEKLSSNIDVELNDVAFTPLDNINSLAKYKRNNLFYGKITFKNRGSVKSRIRGWNITISKPTESFVMFDNSYISNFKGLDKISRFDEDAYDILIWHLKGLKCENIFTIFFAIHEFQDEVENLLNTISEEKGSANEEGETGVKLNDSSINKIKDEIKKLLEKILLKYRELFKTQYETYIDTFQKDLKLYFEKENYFNALSPNSSIDNILLIPYDNSGLINIDIEIFSASIHENPDDYKKEAIIDQIKILKDGKLQPIIDLYIEILDADVRNCLDQWFQEIDFSNFQVLISQIETISDFILKKFTINPEISRRMFNKIMDSSNEDITSEGFDASKIIGEDLNKKILNSSQLNDFRKLCDEINRKIKSLYKNEKEKFYFSKKTTFCCFLKNLSNEFDLANEEYAIKLGQEFISGHLDLAHFDKIYRDYNKSIFQNYSPFFFEELLNKFRDLNPHIQEQIIDYLQNYKVIDRKIAGLIFKKYIEMNEAQKEKYSSIIKTKINSIFSQKDVLNAILENYPSIYQYESYNPIMVIVRDAVQKSKFEEFVNYVTLKKIDALYPKDLDILITEFWNHSHADVRWKVYSFIMKNYYDLPEEYLEYPFKMIKHDGSTSNLKDMGCSLMEGPALTDGLFATLINEDLKAQLLSEIFNRLKVIKTTYSTNFLKKYRRWCEKKGFIDRVNEINLII